ncbi:MAG TPA: hypothetical protein VK446_11390 [Methylocystis sp.]|nr:hypothetical protein [Methylocystis sp.]
MQRKYHRQLPTKQTTEYVVQVWVGRTNRKPLDLLDHARRQVDHLGPRGIKMKLDQTNELYMEQGYIEFPFPSPVMRERYIARLEENCDSAVKYNFFEREKPFLRSRLNIKGFRTGRATGAHPVNA